MTYYIIQGLSELLQRKTVIPRKKKTPLALPFLFSIIFEIPGVKSNVFKFYVIVGVSEFPVKL